MKSLLFFAFTLSCLVDPLCAQKYDIKLKLEVGDQFTEHLDFAVVVNQSAGEIEGEMVMKARTVTQYTVAQVKPQSVIFSVSIMEMFMQSVYNGEVQYTIDTQHPEENEATYVVKSVMGRPFTMEVNLKGKVLAIRGMDENLREGVNAIPDIDEAQRAMIYEGMKAELGGQKLKNDFELSTAVMPPTPVELGATWKRKMTVVTNVQMQISETLKLLEVTDEFYIVTSIFEAKTDENERIVMEGETGILNMTGSGTNLYKLDRKTGWLVYHEKEMASQGKITIQAPEAPGGVFNMPMTISVHQTVK